MFRPSRAAAAALALVGFACASPALGAGGSVPATGMAGTWTALAEGLDATRWNPANLAYSDRPGLSVEFFSGAAVISNNGIDLGLYNRTMGARIDEAHKQEILSAIPAEGLAADAELNASALGVQVGRIAVSLDGRSAGYTNLPHEVFSLLLTGNASSDSLSFDGAAGEAVATAAFRLSGAATLGDTRWGPVHLGLTMSYLQGLAYARLDEVSGTLVTSPSGVRGEALATMTTAGMGSGFGVDLALSSEWGSRWRVGLALENAFARVHFDQNTEKRTFLAASDTLDVETLESTDDSGDLFSSEEFVEAAAPFTVDLARVLRLGAARTGERLRYAVEWQQGFENRAGSSTTPRVSSGVEWRGIGWMPLRLGLAVGGRSSRVASAGLGFAFGGFRLDLAAATVGEWWPGDPKGVSLAIGSGLRF